MRYGIVFIILAALFMVMPTEKAKKDEKRSEIAVAQVFSKEEQESALNMLDKAVNELREMPPLHQVLVMTTFIILIINAAVVLAYVVNSIASIANIGISVILFLPVALVALLFKSQRKPMMRRLERHPEFGPFVRKISTRMWQRRFRRAAREHGFASQYSY